MSGIKVTNENYTIAETDNYFSDITNKYGTNTFRHARRMSSKDEQFVIRENQDVMYSHMVVDCSEGATLSVPEWDLYQIIQIIDENQYTPKVIYPGETFELTPDMLSLGSHVFLNCRTAARSLDEEGYKEANAQQDKLKVVAKSNKPYQPKGFDKDSLIENRKKLVKRMPECTDQRYFFGTKDQMTVNDKAKEQFLIVSACGWGGLPIADATYIGTIQAKGDALNGAPSKLTIPRPPLNYAKGGFYSVTTYDADGWIATDGFALNDHQTTEHNADGSITFHFNAPDQPNNITTPKDWRMVYRLYVPESVDQIEKYIADVQFSLKIEDI